MDVLSEILSAIRLEGALFFNAEFTAPWCLNSSGSAGVRPLLHSKDAHVIVFHFLTEGEAYANLPGGERLQLAKGDIVVMPRGDAHFIGNGAPQRPVDSFATFARNVKEGLRVVQFGGGGEMTRFVCGYMACNPQLCSIFLRWLPPIFRVPVAAGAAGQWIENSIRFSVDGWNEDVGEGRSIVVGKLSEVLFVETLRRYISSLPPGQTGWFAGLRDPALAKALALLHHDPAKQWTVEGLAKQAGISRTRLAERFNKFLKMSPIAYLTEWRMLLAAEALRTTQKSVVEVALDVGYNSEAAFNRAFKRTFRTPPAHFRQSKKEAAKVEGDGKARRKKGASRAGR
jgi:AraC-like DNA-binding protein